ncbi:hypothetical protein Ddye_002435 [Dipteronia dyeriana]|uniref:Uncharacterized protein n=1 Tax=Dipteronia dyeriana TaxID=168575 RepID=A0AAD9XQY1_9ROSI|nr:hypothetical protein Ddye_002435 [Dipteronia dyeriana]
MASRRLGEVIKVSEELIKKAWSLAMKAHKSPEKPYLVEKSRSSSEVIFSFPGSWSVNDWFTGSPFGEKEMELGKFASLKSIGNEDVAIFNEAFLNRFDVIFAQSLLQNEVRKAATEKKQVVFTGHSSGGPIAILAAVWFLQHGLDPNKTTKPLCITFGSPLVGDRIFNHALGREEWSQYFTHFVMRYDIFPRVPLAPFESTASQLHHILPLLNPKHTVNAQEPDENEAKHLYVNVMRYASSVASKAACHLMGNTNKLLETISSFVKLSPYRPFGTYVFCTGNGRLVVVRNPDSVLQILFYSSQLSSGEGAEISKRSVKDHFGYQSEIQSLEAKTVTDLDQFDLSSNGGGGAGSSGIDIVLNDLGLVSLLQLDSHCKNISYIYSTYNLVFGFQSTRARLCLCAAAELEKQKGRNQKKINDKIPDIEGALKILEGYKARCEAREVSYYDAFKASKDPDDFDANVNRLLLVGMWDEIIQMLKKYNLPDGFECCQEWVNLGTRFRYMVEPLDIANYYRHLKHEDTGPYMVKGRPRKYRYAQKWLEYAEPLRSRPCLESCFWAEVEELIQTSNRRDFEAVQAKVSLLGRQVETWIGARVLGDDIFLENSTFVNWWKSLPQHLTSTSWFSTRIK